MEQRGNRLPVTAEEAVRRGTGRRRLPIMEVHGRGARPTDRRRRGRVRRVSDACGFFSSAVPAASCVWQHTYARLGHTSNKLH